MTPEQEIKKHDRRIRRYKKILKWLALWLLICLALTFALNGIKYALAKEEPRTRPVPEWVRIDGAWNEWYQNWEHGFVYQKSKGLGFAESRYAYFVPCMNMTPDGEVFRVKDCFLEVGK